MCKVQLCTETLGNVWYVTHLGICCNIQCGKIRNLEMLKYYKNEWKFTEIQDSDAVLN